MAQWMAQATDVVIPRASQFIFNFIKSTKIGKSNGVAKFVGLNFTFYHNHLIIGKFAT